MISLIFFIWLLYAQVVVSGLLNTFNVGVHPSLFPISQNMTKNNNCSASSACGGFASKPSSLTPSRLRRNAGWNYAGWEDRVSRPKWFYVQIVSDATLFAVSLVVRVGATTDGACSACLTPSSLQRVGVGGGVGWGRHKRGQYPT